MFFHLWKNFPTFTFLCISGCFMLSCVLKKFSPKIFFHPKFFWVKQSTTQCYQAFLVWPYVGCSLFKKRSAWVSVRALSWPSWCNARSWKISRVNAKLLEMRKESLQPRWTRACVWSQRNGLSASRKIMKSVTKDKASNFASISDNKHCKLCANYPMWVMQIFDFFTEHVLFVSLRNTHLHPRWNHQVIFTYSCMHEFSALSRKGIEKCLLTDDCKVYHHSAARFTSTQFIRWGLVNESREVWKSEDARLKEVERSELHAVSALIWSMHWYVILLSAWINFTPNSAVPDAYFYHSSKFDSVAKREKRAVCFLASRTKCRSGFLIVVVILQSHDTERGLTDSSNKASLLGLQHLNLVIQWSVGTLLLGRQIWY